MKKYKTFIGIFVILVSTHLACTEKILDKSPLDKYSDATVWVDVNLCSNYLNYCYNKAQIGQFRNVMIGAVSDEMHVSRGSNSTPYNIGTMTADNTNGAYGNPWYPNSSWAQFANIQRLNLFLDKIDNVANAYSESQRSGVKEKTDILKGEALFLRGFIYTEMCRTYGGVPILSKANKLGDDFSTITRATFRETVDFIIEDLDAATELLPLKSEQKLGRATKEAAMSIKSRMLLFAASDLTTDGTAANATNLKGENVGDLVSYINPDRTALWTSARDAAKAVIDLGTCELADFGAPDQNAVAQNYFNFFKAQTLADNEIIWGIQYISDQTVVRLGYTPNQANGPNGNICFGRNGPFQEMVDEYEMADGSKYSDHYYLDDKKYIRNKSSKYRHENPYYNREPRFYASVLYDSAVWQPRQGAAALRDPLGIYERRLRKNIAANGTVTNVYGLDTRGAAVNPQNGAYGGYLTKKFMDPAIWGATDFNTNVAIEIRYAEILLNYAEACLELGDIATATEYINIIRHRAGMPDFTGDIVEALRHERKVELYAEGFRWYDIRRWKIMPAVFVPCGHGIDIVETINVSTGVRTTTWQQITSQVANKWVDSMWWIPIQTDELKRAPQLKQNPGY